jgi:hypothetical protein
MKNALIGSVVVLGLFAMVCVVIGTGAYVSCVEQETSIVAQYRHNRNDYDNFFKCVVDAAHVTDKYSCDLKKVLDGVMTDRYGNDGVKATLAWIRAHNPTLDARSCTKIQRIVSVGRRDFEYNQKLLIDKTQIYIIQLNSFPSGTVARLLGFPKIDLSKFNVVAGDATTDMFKTKKVDHLMI